MVRLGVLLLLTLVVAAGRLPCCCSSSWDAPTTTEASDAPTCPHCRRPPSPEPGVQPGLGHDRPDSGCPCGERRPTLSADATTVHVAAKSDLGHDHLAFEVVARPGLAVGPSTRPGRPGIDPCPLAGRELLCAHCVLRI